MGGISDWQRFFHQAYRSSPTSLSPPPPLAHKTPRSLHPNGFLELHETPATVFSAAHPPPSSPTHLQAALSLYTTALSTLNRPVGEEVYTFAPLMRAAGFVDVSETRYRLPIGAWGDTETEKEIGQFNTLNFMEGMEGALLACSAIRGVGVREVKEMGERCRSEAKDRRLRLYCWL